MRSAKEILESLGFNKEAPESTKNAFLNNLKRAAQENQKAEVIEPNFVPTINPSMNFNEAQKQEQQLSFDPDLLGNKTNIRLKVGS